MIRSQIGPTVISALLFVKNRQNTKENNPVPLILEGFVDVPFPQLDTVTLRENGFSKMSRSEVQPSVRDVNVNILDKGFLLKDLEILFGSFPDMLEELLSSADFTNGYFKFEEQGTQEIKNLAKILNQKLPKIEKIKESCLQFESPFQGKVRVRLETHGKRPFREDKLLASISEFEKLKEERDAQFDDEMRAALIRKMWRNTRKRVKSLKKLDRERGKCNRRFVIEAEDAKLWEKETKAGLNQNQYKLKPAQRQRTNLSKLCDRLGIEEDFIPTNLTS